MGHRVGETQGKPTAAQIAAFNGDSNPLGGFFTPLYDPLTQIADNTRITATNTGINLKSFALGGGPLGQIGVTPVEFAAFRNRGLGGTNRVQVDVQGAGNLTRLFEEFAENIANHVVNNYARQQSYR